VTKKFRRQVLIGRVSHAYGAQWEKARTACGVKYTHKRLPDAGKASATYASRTSRDVDCMACIAARCEP
jgi:hypothetical protein